MPLTAIAALVRKDLQIFFTDRRAVVLTLAIPIAIASFFGSVFSGQTNRSQAARIHVAMVDQDQSATSRAVVENTAKDTALAVTQPSLDDARASVRGGRLPVAVVIPKGFGDAAGRAFVARTERPQLQLLVDPSKTAEVSMVKGMLTGHVMEAVSQTVFTGTEGQRLIDDGLRSLQSSPTMAADEREALRKVMESAQALYRVQGTGDSSNRPVMGVPFDAAEIPVTGTPQSTYNGYAHAFAGMGIQFALFAALDLAAGILLERERGLWKRFRSAPLSRSTLLVARAISGTVLTLLTLLTGFAFAWVVFKVPITNVIGFFIVALASAMMASAFGLLVASIGGTPAATRRAAMFVVLVMVMLGGAWVPTFIFPAWLQQFTQIVPVRWAVDGLDAMTWRGLDFADVLLPAGLLLAFAAACMTAAMWRFQWDEA
jgi:ABC-2 type transport system permease protein